MTQPQAIVLFDLDGTLVDPAGAITGGIARALRSHTVPVPDAAVLAALVGPPLAHGLLSLPGIDEGNVAAVIADYRAEYRRSGLAQSRVYPGITGLLDALRLRGVRLGVTTSKPQRLAGELLQAQDLAGKFDVVCGSPDDETAGHGPGKTSIVRAALDYFGYDPGRGDRAVVVGDRYFDVDGAAGNGLRCIGVGWGFAPAGELASAGAMAVVGSAAALAEAIEAGLNPEPRAALEPTTEGLGR